MSPALEREKEPELRARKQKLRIDGILCDGKHGSILWKVAGDRVPCATAVAAPEQIGLEVAHLVVVKARIDDIRIMLGGEQPAHIRHVRHAGELVVLGPIPSPVVCHLNQAVIGSDIEQTIFLRRFGERHDVPVKGSGRVLGHCIRSPDASHYRKLVAIDLPREVRADGLPGIAAIVAAE